jgi:hypothetical protein
MTNTKLTLCALAAFFAAGQAFAHTGVRDVATEGSPSFNGFTITHGCGEHVTTGSTQGYPVLGQSAVFPFGANAVWKDAAGTVIQVGGNGNGTITSSTLNLKTTSIGGFSSQFLTTNPIFDDLGNTRAIFWKDGAVLPQSNAITPFKITAPTLGAGKDCTRLKIRVGVINYCDIAKNAANDATGPYNQPKDAFGRPIPMLTDIANGITLPQNISATNAVYKGMRNGNGDNNRQDWWFQDLYFDATHPASTLYTDPDLMEEAGLWSAAISVVPTADRQATCPKDPVTGKSILTDVTVEPAAVDFDTFLTGPNTRPFTKGNSDL